MTKKDFMNKVTNSKDDFFEKFINFLKEKDIKFCVIGGLAVNAYCEPVVSLDLDIVPASEDVEAICKEARERGLKVEQFEHSVNIASGSSDLRIQLQADPRYQSFVSKAQDRDVLGYKMKVARLEDVLQGKVWAYMDKARRKSKRQKDLADIFRIIERYPELETSLPQSLRDELNK
jgi:hypothetical protein